MLLLDLEPEVTMARGMLMLSPKFLLVTPTLVMVLAILVLVLLDLAMDIPTLPPLEPAETILELLSHAKHEFYLTFMIPCLLPFVFNKKSIILLKK